MLNVLLRAEFFESHTKNILILKLLPEIVMIIVVFKQCTMEFLKISNIVCDHKMYMLQN